MDRVNRIWNHPLYKKNFEMLQEAEKNRAFCCHNLEHFLDVARLAYIYSLKDDAEIEPEIIYGAALLHDLGRYMQITEGVPHEKAGAELAGEILPQCGFSQDESSQIIQAILSHRTCGNSQLGEYLYRADKKSRCCFACSAKDECNWSDERKNMEIVF